MGDSEVTGIVLAGGESRRLGRDKALLELRGRSLVEHAVASLQPLCAEVIIVGSPSLPGTQAVADIYPGHGALGGIHAGLSTARTEHSLVVACDMPFLNTALLRYMIEQRAGYDVVMPRLEGLTEPLHALYSRRCLPPIEEILIRGGGRIIEFLPQVRVRYIERAEIERFDPHHRSFFNINTPQDWRQARRWAVKESS